MEAIGHFLSTSDYDIVLLQEVWTEEDFQTLCSLVINIPVILFCVLLYNYNNQ